MRNKRYIKEIGMIHSVLLFLCSIFAVSGIMYASTTMVGLTIVSQEEYDATSGVNMSGDIFSGYDLSGNIETITTTGGIWSGTGNPGTVISGSNIEIISTTGGSWSGTGNPGTVTSGSNIEIISTTGGNRSWPTGNNLTGNNSTGNNLTGNNSTGSNLTGNNSTGNNLTGNNLTGNNLTGNNLTGNNSTGNILYYGGNAKSGQPITTTTGTKKFIISDDNTEKYNMAPQNTIGLIGKFIGNTIKNLGKLFGFIKQDTVANINIDTTEQYHGSANEYMCRVDSIEQTHGVGDLTPLQKAHYLLDKENPTILHTDRTENIYARRFLFSEIIVL